MVNVITLELSCWSCVQSPETLLIVSGDQLLHESADGAQPEAQPSLS